ncbi:MAG: L-aspartate oxidase [Phycisphaerae bacterium]|nr:L-aspartate oxidase [Phycisphaerae bacterium]
MFDTRRYLTLFHYARTPHILTDVLVIGGGIAGLRAALAAAEQASVILLHKEEILESNTRYAQGGIAVPTSDPDSVASHIQDTLTVACGIAHEPAVRFMVEQAASRVQELVDWGVVFDQKNGRLAYATEGAHSQPRVLHSQGDATGQELARVLVERVRSHPHIRIFDHCFAIDLLTIEGRCVGAVTFHRRYGHQLLWSRQTILASGGCGRVYRETTNPAVATGDGLAMAFRAGAQLQDMEMVQFHPTALYVAGASRALISEAVRGEGGLLVDQAGHRFMPEYHPAAELAPRDVVSRAIRQHLAKTRTNSVYLDVRHFPRGEFRQRFPTIAQMCSDFDLDVERDPIPVRPAAHYMIGGVSSDMQGRTTLPGLWAVGEVAATGVHGANRLASNSLLEGLVFGAEAGVAAAADSAVAIRPVAIESTATQISQARLDLPDLQNSLRSVMWRNVGVMRDSDRLSEMIGLARGWGSYLFNKVFDSPDGWETQNLLTLSFLIALSARQRCESRGVHFRSDMPEPNEAQWRIHVALQRTAEQFQIFNFPV